VKKTENETLRKRRKKRGGDFKDPARPPDELISHSEEIKSQNSNRVQSMQENQPGPLKLSRTVSTCTSMTVLTPSPSGPTVQE
jgi:hypothetical protein